jgi:hypothetical protein
MITPQKAIPRPLVREPAHKDERYDRQRAFFPAAMQAAIADAPVVLVGAGGTGSIAGESLLRLGFENLTIIDHDLVEPSNLNRLQAFTDSQTGKAKAACLARRLAKYNRKARIRRRCVTVADCAHEGKLWAGAALLVGCVDDDRARLILSHLSAAYMIPYVDMASRVFTENGNVAFSSRVVVTAPGATACLFCAKSAKVIDRQALAETLIDPITRKARAAAGYVAGKDQSPTPALYALNQRAVSMGMFEILNLMTSRLPLAGVVHETYGEGVHRLPADPPDPECPVCGEAVAGLGPYASIPLPSNDERDAAMEARILGDIAACKRNSNMNMRISPKR